MNIIKKIVFIFALVVVAVVDILIYWNSHLYYQVKEIEDSDILLRYIKLNVIDRGLNKKVRILHQAEKQILTYYYLNYFRRIVATGK